MSNYPDDFPHHLLDGEDGEQMKACGHGIDEYGCKCWCAECGGQIESIMGKPMICDCAYQADGACVCSEYAGDEAECPLHGGDEE